MIDTTVKQEPQDQSETSRVAVQGPGARIRRVITGLLSNRCLWVACGVLLLCTLATMMRASAQGSVVMPKISIGVDTAKNPKDVSVTLQILILMTVLTL